MSTDRMIDNTSLPEDSTGPSPHRVVTKQIMKEADVEMQHLYEANETLADEVRLLRDALRTTRDHLRIEREHLRIETAAHEAAQAEKELLLTAASRNRFPALRPLRHLQTMFGLPQEPSINLDSTSPADDPSPVHPEPKMLLFRNDEQFLSLFESNFYRAKYPDVPRSADDAVEHYLRFGAAEGRDPHPFFDATFYKQRVDASRSPDQFDSDLLPHETVFGLIHYLTIGHTLGWSPHQLFDGEYFLAQLDDSQRDTIPLWVQYLRSTNLTLQTHPDFDANYYITTYPDVVKDGAKPLIHYLEHGWREGRRPSAVFDTIAYRAQYPDVIAAGFNPLVHYVVHGKTEGRRITFPKIAFSSLFTPLASKNILSSQGGPSVPVHVIVPVYRGTEETKRCIESVFASTQRTPFHLVLINDASPEPGMAEYLKHFASYPPIPGRTVTLLTNQENIGFVKSVNKGIELAATADVVLLNSDTEVPDGWLDRLRAHAYRPQQDRPHHYQEQHLQQQTSRVATVTALSNNATIASFPGLPGDANLPEQYTLSDLDSAAQQANLGVSIPIPTAVGFCMYITRSCLNEIGGFDDATFGKGYGEENDFSLRAHGKGWSNLLALDTLVYHRGETSFGEESNDRKAEATRLLVARYPDYSPMIQRHVLEDPAKPYRIRIFLELLTRSKKPVTLLISHALGGGVERHLRDKTASLSADAQVLRISPTPAPRVGIRIQFMPALFLDFDLESNELAEAAKIIAHLPVNRVEVHHTAGYHGRLEQVLRAFALPFSFVVHDYFTVCPFVTLSTEEGIYCGEPVTAGCNRCIQTRSLDPSLEILRWRESHRWFLTEAEEVLCPSMDVLSRILRYIPTAQVLFRPHDEVRGEAYPRITPPRHGNQTPLRIAVLGTMVRHKGLRLLTQVAQAIEAQELPFHLTLIGAIETGVTDLLPTSVTVTGSYDGDTELLTKLTQLQPHIIWFPGEVPETYSYTLSTALPFSAAIVAPKLGSFPERLNGRGKVELFTVPGSVDTILKSFVSVMSSTTTLAIAPTNLLHLDRARTTPTPTLRPKIAILTSQVAPGLPNSYPDPCGYIRLFLPFTHPRIRTQFHIEFITESDLEGTKSDVLIIQRDAAASERGYTALRRARAEGRYVIHDIDDNLFELGESHDDFATYKERLSHLRESVLLVDEFWVSTPFLATRIRRVAPQAKVRVLPNKLDERLWFLTPQESHEAPLFRRAMHILCMGTETHSADFKLIEEPLYELKRRYKNRLEIDIVGFTSQQDLPTGIRRIKPKKEGTYPLFVEWLRTFKRWDIGLAPLQSNKFTLAKSPLKFFDYAALGITPLVSSGTVYDNVVRHGQNGYLIGSSPSDWYDAIAHMLEDRWSRIAVAHTAQEEVREKFTVESALGQWIDALEAVFERSKTSLNAEMITK